MSRIQALLSSQYLRNIGWLGFAELVQRIFRLVATVMMARLFTQQDYGMVAAVYTIFEFANTVSCRGGISAKLIQAKDSDLETFCHTAYWINWLMVGSLFIFQCLLAYPIARFYGNMQLVWPICVLGLSYCIIPAFIVQAALLERQNQLQVQAWAMAAQSIVSNLILVLLAWRGFGVWSVVWGMVLSYLVWIPIIYRFNRWRPKHWFYFERWREVLGFGTQRLGVDLLSRFRREVDYLVVARLLGLEALGIYFFAYSAGIGISQSVINSLTIAWYPYFCEVRADRRALRDRFLKSLRTIATLVVPLVVLQTTLAPFYVPIVFGKQWTSAIPILILICCSAIPLALSNATSQLLQAVDQIALDIAWNVVFTLVFVGAIVAVIKGGIGAVAVAVLVTQAIAFPLFALWVYQRTFRAQERLDHEG